MARMDSATVVAGSQTFTASPNGFRWLSNGMVEEGPWSRVASVMTLRTSASISGATIGSWQHFAVTLDNGETFRIQSSDPGAFPVAQLTVQYAAPWILPRVLQQLDAGQVVSFGSVQLSREQLTVGKKSWPLAQLAGHRTAHGHWMLDVGPRDAPTLAAMVMLNQLPNHFALRAGLERLVPGSEYAEGGPDLGTVMRPSASSHDPRTLSGRSRVLFLAGATALALLIGGGVLGGFEVSRRLEKQRIAEYQARTDAKVAQLAGIAKALVPADVPFLCAQLPKDADDAVFLVETPQSVAHPWKGKPYEFSYTNLEDIPPAMNPTHAVAAKVRSFQAGAGGLELYAGLAVIDVASGQVVCSGQVHAIVESTQSPELRLAQALAAAVCRPGATGLACERAMRGVKVLAEAPKPAPVAVARPWAKGDRVEAQRKGKWVPAVILQVTKAGVRVHYDGQNKKRDEVVPVSRLRRP
jgi:hypothetical protein